MAIKALNLFIFSSLAGPQGILIPPCEPAELPCFQNPTSHWVFGSISLFFHPLARLECRIPSGPAGNPPKRGISTYIWDI